MVTDNGLTISLIFSKPINIQMLLKHTTNPFCEKQPIEKYFNSLSLLRKKYTKKIYVRF